MRAIKTVSRLQRIGVKQCYLLPYQHCRQETQGHIGYEIFNDPDKNIVFSKTENDGLDFVGKKPFVMKIAFDGKELVQKAGADYLFSVGKLIGSQMELYQENKRVLPVEIDHLHSYIRNIKIKIPKGMKAKNLDKFVMDFKTQIQNKTEDGFCEQLF